MTESERLTRVLAVVERMTNKLIALVPLLPPDPNDPFSKGFVETVTEGRDDFSAIMREHLAELAKESEHAPQP